MAVSMVKKAIHPLGLYNQDRAIKALEKNGCGVLFNTEIKRSIQKKDERTYLLFTLGQDHVNALNGLFIFIVMRNKEALKDLCGVFFGCFG